MVQLINGDCLVEMKSIPDKSIKMKQNINYYL